MLMIARLTLTLRRTALPEAAVLIDDTLSMTVADRPKPTDVHDGTGSRWDILRRLLTAGDGEWFRRLAENHRLRVYFLSGKNRGQKQDVPDIVAEIRSSAPTGKSTRLGEAILTALDDPQGPPPSAIIALTDGINTDGTTPIEAAGQARRRGVPLWFVGVGSERPLPDLKLSDLTVDDIVFVDDVVNFECKLTSVGYKGQEVSIALRKRTM